MGVERRFNSEGRLIVDWDEVSAAARSWGRPTPDDVSVTSDGRRIDAADKLRELIAEYEEHQRGRARSAAAAVER